MKLTTYLLICRGRQMRRRGLSRKERQSLAWLLRSNRGAGGAWKYRRQRGWVAAAQMDADVIRQSPKEAE
jgi:hypothetical protein